MAYTTEEKHLVIQKWVTKKQYICSTIFFFFPPVLYFQKTLPLAFIVTTINSIGSNFFGFVIPLMLY